MVGAPRRASLRADPSYQVPGYGGPPQPQPQYAYAGAMPVGGGGPAKRSAAYYVLVGVAAVALFATSMFVTVLLLR